MAYSHASAIDTTIIGKIITPFSAPMAQGEYFNFDRFPDAKAIAIVFTCNHCPFAELYIQRMNDFYHEYAPLGIPLIAINPMDSIIYEDETLEEMKKKVIQDSIVYPYLQDYSQSIARIFKAAFTPQVFVIQRRYPEKAIPFLKNTAKAILSNQKIPEDIIDSFGCKITYRSP
jgi:hypothetical protein